MSFFLANAPDSVTSSFEKPRIDERAQAGAPSSRRFGVAYWRGEMNFGHQPKTSTLLGELERADALDGAFYADLYDRSGPREPAQWVTLTSLTATGMTTAHSSAAGYDAGAVVSLRSTLGLEMVTARVTTSKVGSGPYTFEWETPLPGEFVTTRAGVTFQACFNRPHVRARIKSDSLQWTTSYTREMRPMAVGWFEDSTTMVTSLYAAARSPVPPGEVPDQSRFLITEGGDYLTTEDGRFLTTED